MVLRLGTLALMGLTVITTPLAAQAPPPADGVSRSALFTFEAGDAIEDSGTMAVKSGRFARSEDFEVVRKADGGRVLTSIITAADGSYRVEARAVYGPGEQAIESLGEGRYAGEAANVRIIAAPPSATIAVSAGQVERTVTAPCDPCLIDMSPTALPMFTMTRRYDEAQGGRQAFHWIGQSLVVDQVLLEGTAEIELIDTSTFDGPEGPVTVKRYGFVEALTDAKTGAVANVSFNLYVDGNQRPLAFAIPGSTGGTRAGYESLLEAMPPVKPFE